MFKNTHTYEHVYFCCLSIFERWGKSYFENSSRYYFSVFTFDLQILQPTYQNREAIEETITKSSSTTYTQNPSTGGKMPSLNNNLSELDTLLQDLSNARYNSHYHERG